MSRLTHHPAALRKAHVMSKTELFIYVEGVDNDRLFIGGILAKMPQFKKLKFEIRLAEEITGKKGGGKSILIGFHNQLRSLKQLKHNEFGKTTYHLFIVDKDDDDVTGKIIRSRYIIYSRFYTIENHLLYASNIHKAMASASSLPESEIKKFIPNHYRWLKRAKNNWKDWLSICHFVSSNRIRNYTTYGRNCSPVNSPACAAACPTRLQQEMATLRSCSGWSQAQLDLAIQQSRLEVEKRLKRGGDCIFKGKWYSNIALSEIKSYLSGKRFNENQFGHKFDSAIAAVWRQEDKYFEAKLKIFVEKIIKK